jgi:hypothetical protein
MRNEMRAAIDRFAAAGSGESLTNMAQLLPHLRDADKFSEAFRPLVAYMDYVRDHQRHPRDPIQLERYLKGSFEPATAMRRIRVGQEDGNVSWGLNPTQ